MSGDAFACESICWIGGKVSHEIICIQAKLFVCHKFVSIDRTYPCSVYLGILVLTAQ